MRVVNGGVDIKFTTKQKVKLTPSQLIQNLR